MMQYIVLRDGVRLYFGTEAEATREIAVSGGRMITEDGTWMYEGTE